jgi:hypothetical protein
MVAIGIGLVVGVVVIGGFVLTVVAIVIGEQQSHDRADDVASAYRSARPGEPETVLRDELGEPSLILIEAIHGRKGRCLYRVLLTARGALSLLLRRQATCVEEAQLEGRPGGEPDHEQDGGADPGGWDR